MKNTLNTLLFFIMVGCASSELGRLSNEPDHITVAGEAKLQTFNRGQEIFASNCARCHEQEIPKLDSKTCWHSLPALAWNAELAEADEKAVIAYIKTER